MASFSDLSANLQWFLNHVLPEVHPEADEFEGLIDFLFELESAEELNFVAVEDALVSGGALTVVQVMQTVRGEGASADNVDNITGLNDGALGLYVTGAEAITYRDNAIGGGNVSTSSAASLVTATGDLVLAVRSGSVVRVSPLVIAGGLALDGVALAQGRIPVGTAGGDAGGTVDVGGTAQGVAYGDGLGGVAVGTIGDHGASTSTATSPGTSDSDTASIGGSTASSTAAVSMGGTTASGTAAVAGSTASGTASIGVGGSTDSASASMSGSTASGTASVAMGGSTASDSASLSGSTASGTAAVGGTSASDTASVSMGGSTASGTASVSEDDADVRTETWSNPAAAGTNIVAQIAVDTDETTWGNITQPDVRRNVQVVFSAGWDGGDIEVTGIDQTGDDVAETITASAGATVEGTSSYSLIRRVRNLGTRTAGTADVQTGPKPGLLIGSKTPALLEAYETSAGGRDAGASLSAAGLLTPTSAPDGVRDYLVTYSLAGTYTDSGHTHGATGLTATDAGHTHGAGTIADSGHTHGVGTIADSGHTHGATGLTATDSGHTHGVGTIADGGHTHGSSALTATDSGHTHGVGTIADGGHTHGATGLTATDSGHTHGAGTIADSGHTHAHTATHTHDVTPPAHSIS